jgi:hypothetical protein
VDGKVKVVGGGTCSSTYNNYASGFNQRRVIAAPVTLALAFPNASTAGVTVTNTSASAVQGKLFVAVVERHIPYTWYDQSEVDFVVRSLLPSATGQDVSIPAGQSVTHNQPFTLGAGWSRPNVQIVAFLQASDKEVLQAARSPLPDPGSILLTSPEAGDLFIVGSVMNVAWSSQGFTGNVDVYLSTKESTWVPLAHNIANSGTFDWLVTDLPTTRGRVKVSATDSGYPFAQSPETFSIIRNGDIDGDGQVLADDLVLLSAWLAGDAEAFPMIDIDGDKAVTAVDLVLLAQQVIM